MSWCGKNDKRRVFEDHDPVVCYSQTEAINVSKDEYDRKRRTALAGQLVQDFIVPKKSALAWKMQKGDLCRVTVNEGSQVGDINMWNLDDPKERFFSGKTRQLHSTHLKMYDRLWSNLPYLRPMATFVFDSLKDYGIDKDGGSLHDVIGTRCDNYTYKLITGKDRYRSCHSHIRDAIKEFGLEESDVHDVWNIFMCTGITKDTLQYFAKPSPARKGDFIEFVADMNLIVCLSACPHGDVSVIVGDEIPDSICHSLQVQVFREIE